MYAIRSYYVKLVLDCFNHGRTFNMPSRTAFATWRRPTKWFILLGGAAAWPLTARAQQPEHMRRVGVLMGYPAGDRQAQAGADALRKGLQDLGWIEGRNVQFDFRWPGPDASYNFV